MDESFQLRAERLLRGSRPARLDHAMLTAALAAQRAANGAPPVVALDAAAAPSDPLTEILLAGPRWRQAASAQSGCFNRTEVKRRLNVR